MTENKHIGSRFDLAELTDTAVERVARAIWQVEFDEMGYPDPSVADRYWEDQWNAEFNGKYLYRPRMVRNAAAAITAYNAYLRERAQDADVVEAVCKETALYKLNRRDAQEVITAALDALLGKEPR